MPQRFETWAENFRIYFAGERGQAWLKTIGATLGDYMEQGGIAANRETMPEYATETRAPVFVPPVPVAERGAEARMAASS